MFKNKSLVSVLKGVTLIKANAESELAVKSLGEYDQKYVPKTIVIDGNGEIVHGIFGEKEDFMFFLPTDEPLVLMRLASIVKTINKKV